MNKITSALVATAFTAAGALTLAPSPAQSSTVPVPASMNRPCASEDSVNCYWDAGRSGNHRGHSFYVRQFPGRAHMVCVMYVKRTDARRWDYCEATR